jgi:uncharacterized protein (DUF1800 family)
MLKRSTAIALNRFGLGARPADAGRVAGDPAGWLEQQIEAGPGPATDQATRQPSESAPDSATRARSESAPDSTTRARPESATVLERITELRLARQAARSRRANEPIEVDQDAIREFARFIATSYQTQARAMYLAAIDSEQPFRERLVQFWQNHFAVSADKQPVGAIAGLYGDEAIRPHVSGNFRELLTAAIRHPAMLLYLDNQTSIGPRSRLATLANRRANRRVGLNENLAREVLELHTLGVDGGYTQDDVIEFAKCLTGWSIGGAGGPGAATRMAALARRLVTGADEGDAPGEFAFRAAVHEPGSKTILGRRFAEGGVDEAESVLHYLARRPQTARHLATKLARHFLADEPPPKLVDALARVYLDNDGELAPVYRRLVQAEESWREPLAKYKTPQDFLISTYRALGTAPPGNRLPALATQLGQRPLTPGSPAGWPDTADSWNGGDALFKRIEWATATGRQTGDRIDAVDRLDAVLGETASETTRNGVRRAESGAQAIALLFSAPEFQRR